MFPVRLRRIGIRPRLVALVALTAAPLLVVIVLDGARDRDHVLTEALERNAALARLAAAEQANLIEQARTALGVLKGVPGLAADAAMCRAAMRQLVRDNPQFNSAGVADADGMVTCDSHLEEPERFGDPAFFAQVTSRVAASFHLGRFRMATTVPGAVITAAMPIYLHPGLGMIFVSLKLDGFAKILDTLPDPGHLQLSVIDGRDGTFLVRKPDEGNFTGRPATDPTNLQRLHAAPLGHGSVIRSVSGEDVVAAWAPLTDDGADSLFVVITSPLWDVIMVSRDRILTRLGILLAALVTVGLADWAMFEFSLLRPLQAIQQIASRLGAGDLRGRVPAPGRNGRELRVLAKTLNVTAGRLQRASEATKAALEKLSEREAEYRQLADNTSDMIIRVDPDLVQRFVSRAAWRMLGYPPDALVGHSLLHLLHRDDQERVEQVLELLLEDRDWASVAYRMRRSGGQHVFVEAHFRAMREPVAGALVGIVATVRDVTERTEAEAIVRASEARYRLLADHSTDMIIQVDTDFRRVYVSPSCRVLLGYEPEAFTALTLSAVVHPKDLAAVLEACRKMALTDEPQTVRYRYRRQNGSYLWVEAIGRTLAGNAGFVINVRDLTHRLEIEQSLEAANRRLETLASQDGLTGLANRRCFDETLAAEFRRTARAMMPLSLILFDVDHFKRYNDTYGHPTGDACLQAVAAALQRTVRRPSDLVARYGGEEMAVLLPDTEAAGAMAMAEQMRLAVRALEREHVASPAGVVTVSAGVASLYPGVSQEAPAALVALADRALYQAKAGGRDRVAEAAEPAAPYSSAADAPV